MFGHTEAVVVDVVAVAVVVGLENGLLTIGLMTLLGLELLTLLLLCCTNNEEMEAGESEGKAGEIRSSDKTGIEHEGKMLLGVGFAVACVIGGCGIGCWGGVV